MIYEQYYGYALKIAFRYSYDYRRATDIVNDGFVKFFSNIGSFIIDQGGHSEPALMIWIKRLMVKAAVAELKRNNFLYKAGDIPEQFWQTAGPQQDADMLLKYRKLICHLKSLPPFYGVVYNMYVIDGFSHPEIAVQRKTDEDSQSVRTRSTEIWKLSWENTDVHVIDASKSKTEVASEIKTLIWSQL